MPDAPQFGIRGENVVCFAGEDWWYHHPHSKNHIMRRFARENKVLFVNSLSMGLPSVSNPDYWMKIRRKLASYVRWLRKVESGLWVLSPIMIPSYRNSWIRTINRLLVHFQVHIAMMIAGMSNPIVWVAIPSAADVAISMRKKALVYQISDKYNANEDSSLEVSIINDWDRKLKEISSHVFYSGRKLFAESAKVHNRYFLEQAVDFEHFSQENVLSAPEVANIKHPVLFYMGAMDHVMDTALVADVAQRKPQWNFVFVGLRSNSVQVNASNVHFLGPQPYHKLPQFLAHADVCILPWRVENIFTSYGSAIKVREYLASGKPVVIAPLYEYLDTPGLRIYQGVEQFIAQVENALAENEDQVHSHDQKEFRRLQVKDHTWDIRTREVGKMLLADLTPEK